MRALGRTRRHDGRGRAARLGDAGATLRKLGVDVVVRGECEEVVAALADGGRLVRVSAFHRVWRRRRAPRHRRAGGQRFVDLPAAALARRVDRAPPPSPSPLRRAAGRVRAPRSRRRAAAPITAASAPRSTIRDEYRRRDLAPLLEEIDGLIAQGVGYIYFIDEIFLPQRPLLEALVERDVQFGVQTRIDLWKPDLLELLGRAGCVSIEAGIESLTVEGRAALGQALPA